MSCIPPGIGEFLLRNHLSDLTKMVIFHAFMLDGEFKFKTNLWLKFLEVEIPAPDFLRIGERLPDPRNRGVEISFDNNCLCQLMLRSHIFSLSVQASYSSWRRNQRSVSLRPLGARSSHWYMPQRPSSPRE